MIQTALRTDGSQLGACTRTVCGSRGGTSSHATPGTPARASAALDLVGVVDRDVVGDRLQVRLPVTAQTLWTPASKRPKYMSPIVDCASATT